jgi:hypothetical protein
MTPLTKKYLARFVQLAIANGIDVNRLRTMTLADLIIAIDAAQSAHLS